jgi:hypothetical protein
LFFDETDKGAYFTDPWGVEIDGIKHAFFLGLDDPKGPINKDTEFLLPIMKSLAIAKILPVTEHKKPVYSFHYKGSATKPPCDENVYWFVYEEILDIKSNTIAHL